MTKGDTKISWTNKTWNPVHGCSKVSEGCDHCYAETLSLKRGWTSEPWTRENAEANVQVKLHKLQEPFRWREPARVFVNSMSDLFHDLIPDEYIEQVFAVMALTPQHTYQVLTKRPGRMASFTNRYALERNVAGAAYAILKNRLGPKTRPLEPLPLPNVWLGTSVENQRWADVRIPKLLQTDAAVRFLSCEPLLGPIDLFGDVETSGPAIVRRGVSYPTDYGTGIEHDYDDQPGIDWVIVGGESGPHLTDRRHPRWMQMEWARQIRDACVENEVAFFFKQDSGRRTELRPWVVEPDGSRWEWHQFPGDLREPVPIP